MANGYSVVVDDTNLRKNFWKDFQTLNLNEYEEVDLTGVSLELCNQRDRCRDAKVNGRVGRAIIDRMALTAGLVPFDTHEELKGRQIVIVDIDGTVADLDHRLGFIKNPTAKDYQSFFATVHLDKPLQFVIDWVRALYEDYIIVFVSGRGSECAIETEEWLYKYGPPFDLLLMRKSNDKRDDRIIKKEILDELLTAVSKERIAFAIDDRPRVIEMWRSNGIRVIPVNQEKWEGIDDLSS